MVARTGKMSPAWMMSKWLGKGRDEKTKDETDFYLKDLKHMYQVDEVRLIMVDYGWINV